jgi:hypothetical protein
MINYFATVYKDSYKVQNARLDYKSLMMKPTEAFGDFHTHFLPWLDRLRSSRTTYGWTYSTS